MAFPPENEALLPTREVGHAPRVGERLTGLPIDLLIQSVSRLRVLALLYAFVFFMVELLPALLFQQDRARMLGSFVLWGPGVISIAVALSVAALIQSGRVPLSVKMNIGLAFELAASYGIAAAEFLDPSSLAVKGSWTGLSWVAVWTALFTIVVPTKPRRALAAALGSVSAVPVMVGSAIATGHASFTLSPLEFVLGSPKPSPAVWSTATSSRRTSSCAVTVSVFTADTPTALLLHHAQTPATPPSARTEMPIPSALDDLVLSCLAKDPATRPQAARELSRRLASVKGANDWTDDRARDWWASHQPAAS